jgi:putative sigma-54 modulation protein
MKLILSAHNIKLTEAIEKHIVDKVEKLAKLDIYAVGARVTIEHDTTKPVEKKFKCSLKLDRPGPDLFAEDYEEDLYAAIDLVTKKVEQQIRTQHSKFKARKHTEAARSKLKRQERND